MNEKRNKKISKFLSLVLRHKPEAIGLNLDESGWAQADELLAKSREHGTDFSIEQLNEVVKTNDKNRFSFDETGSKIRANQGHSVTINLELEKKLPPENLFHGTAERNVEAIKQDGLKKMQRHHVHLAEDRETAKSVGMRYGKPVIFLVDTVGMLADGYDFYISENGVWLVNEVPAQFLEIT